MTTQSVKAPPITVEQYEVFEGFPGLRDELINGEIVLSPQPKPLHQQVSENIHRLLNKVLNDPFVAKQNSNIKFREANSMPAPDIFVVRRADWREACESDQYLDKPPVLAVEVIFGETRAKRARDQARHPKAQGVSILSGGAHPRPLRSPANRKVRVAQKIDIYLTNGVSTVWVCYPKKRLLRTHRIGEVVELSQADIVTLPQPLHGQIKVCDMFLLD